jgi:hypothetical protein
MFNKAVPGTLLSFGFSTVQSRLVSIVERSPSAGRTADHKLPSRCMLDTSSQSSSISGHLLLTTAHNCMHHKSSPALSIDDMNTVFAQ